MGWISSSISTWNLIPSRHFGSHLLPIPSLFSIQHQMSVHLRVKVNRLPGPQIPSTWMASAFYFPESSVHPPPNILLPAPGHLRRPLAFLPTLCAFSSIHCLREVYSNSHKVKCVAIWHRRTVACKYLVGRGRKGSCLKIILKSRTYSRN